MPNNTKILNARVQLRTHTKFQWETEYNTDVLLKGETGIEIDTNKFKFGNGVDNWDNLDYASGMAAELSSNSPTINDIDYDKGQLWIKTSEPQQVYILMSINGGSANWKRVVTAEELDQLGYGDMLQIDFATDPNDPNTPPSEEAKYVDNAKFAKTSKNVKGNGKLGTTEGETPLTNRQPDDIFEDNSNTVKRATADKNGNDISTTYINVNEKGQANGVATLDENGKIFSVQLPSYVDDVVKAYVNYAHAIAYINPNGTLYQSDWLVDAENNPLILNDGEKYAVYTQDANYYMLTYIWNATAQEFQQFTYTTDWLYTDETLQEKIIPEIGKIYIVIGEGHFRNRTYRYSSTANLYVQIKGDLVLGEEFGTAFPGDRGKAIEDYLEGLLNNNEEEKVNIAKVFITDGDTLIIDCNIN